MTSDLTMVPLLAQDATSPATVESEHAILQAVVQAATAFLRSADLADSVSALLAGIGTATRASRAYVFENDPPSGAALTASQCAEWTAAGIAPRAGTPAVQHIALEAPGFEPWLQAFTRGEPCVAVVADLPPMARERFRAMQIASTVAAPIFVEADLWGFIGVDDCRGPRQWSTIEVEALSAGAVVIGAALRRQRIEAALRDATVQAQLAADIGDAVTRAGGTIEQLLERCTAAIVNRLQPDYVRIWMMSEDLECLLACRAAGAGIIQDANAVHVPLVSTALMEVVARDAMTSWRDGIPSLWPGSEVEFEAAGLQAGIGLPLVIDGRAAGVVVMLGRAFPARHVIAALASVTDELALAIERHHAQGAATRAELRYRRLVDATIEGIVIHDGTRVVDANPSFAAMLGFSLEEIIGRHPFDFIAPDYHDLVRANLQSNYRYPYEVEGVHRDGTRFSVELKGTDFVDHGMKLRVASVRDITDRKAVQKTAAQLRAEQDARAIAERMRAQAVFLGDASRILASSLDSTTTLTQLAHLAIPTLGDYAAVSLVEDGGVKGVAVVHADPEREQVLRAAVDAWPEKFPPTHPIYSALVAGRTYVVEEMTDETLAEIAVTPQHHEYLRALGAQSMMAVPITSGGVVMGGIILSFTGPGRRYNADDLALAEEFAHRAALALQAARSYHLAQGALRARDELLAVVAHDLRNPLNTIVMGSELALEMNPDADSAGARQLQIIRRSATQMNRLIQDLLDASRLDSGTLALEKMPVAPADLLREAGDMLAPLAAHAKIALEADAEDGLPSVIADRGRLLQVLSNLVGNALKFTPSGGTVRVSITCGGDELEDTRVVTFAVRDTGSGIDEEQLPHIFSRGWQARRGDRRGIGLGLAIASGIVEAHGGRIWAESKPGEGSTFRFTVPASADSPSVLM